MMRAICTIYMCICVRVSAHGGGWPVVDACLWCAWEANMALLLLLLLLQSALGACAALLDMALCMHE